MRGSSAMPAPTAEDLIDGLEQLAQLGVPAPGLARQFDVGTGPFLSYVDDELFEQLVSHGGATCKVLEGPYGAGKSHVLQLLEDSALHRGMCVARAELSGTQHLEDWHLIAKFVLQNLEFETGRGVVRSLPRVLEALHEIHGRGSRELQPSSLPHQGFARAMGLITTASSIPEGGRARLRRYLEGENVTAGDLKAHGVTGVKQPLSRRNAELVVKTVMTGLHRLGARGTLLLFDENEKTFQFSRSTPPKKIRVAANLLRRLIDGTANGSLSAALVVFAVLPGFIENCSLAYPALGQRLHRDSYRENVGWRFPVLPVDGLILNDDPDAFVEAFVDRVNDVIDQIGTSLVPRLTRQAELLLVARAAAERQAGSGFRRHVVKQVATNAIRYI
jgi:hypothetical protein